MKVFVGSAADYVVLFPHVACKYLTGVTDKKVWVLYILPGSMPHKSQNLEQLLGAARPEVLLIIIGAGVLFSLQTSSFTYHIPHKIICYLECNSYLDWFFSIDYATTLHITFSLMGQGARAYLRGVYALNADQHLRISIQQKHYAPSTLSTVLIKGAIDDRAEAACSDAIYIGPNAKDSNALQKNSTLLLSRQAHVRSIPSLEVLQDDVQCSHGSAVGQFSADELFYLSSRGLEKKRAEALLLEAFFADMAQPIDDCVFKTNAAGCIHDIVNYLLSKGE